MPTRRNVITLEDAYRVLVVAAVSGVAAALAGCHPTGEAVPDAVLTFAFAAFVTWLGASASWWSLVVACGIAAAGAAASPVALVVFALIALAGAGWIGVSKASLAMSRAAVAALVAQVVLRVQLHDFFLESALVATAAVGVLAIAGLQRRPKYVRRRVLWSTAGVVLAAIVACAGMGVAALRSKSAVEAGYHALLKGLDQLKDGDMQAAATSLRTAAADLDTASGRLGGALTQGARLVPGVAQNRAGATALLAHAASASRAAAATLAVVDLDQLKIVNGLIDTDAVAVLAKPLADLDATVKDLSAALEHADSPWLVGPFQDKVAESRDRAAKVQVQADASAAAAVRGPALLGANGLRRYLLAFVNPAEARGIGGLMGNWSVITIDHGKLAVEKSGRSARLQDTFDGKPPLFLNAPADYLARYGNFDAGSATFPVQPKYWSNVTMSPDMAIDGSVMSQMYDHGTGEHLDGVFVVDPDGMAALLGITGPITVPGVDQQLDTTNIAQLLLLGQYTKTESQREDLLAAITDQTVKAVLSSSLPAPQKLAAKLGPAALEGHITTWAANADDEHFLQLVGMDGNLPTTDDDLGSADALAVVTNNESGNKIDSFLQRTVTYDPVFDPHDGHVDSTLTITLQNSAPTSGYDDYVIGNIVNVPKGANQTFLSIYTRLHATSMTVNGRSYNLTVNTEDGYNVYSTYTIVVSGATVTVQFQLTGRVASGQYALVYRPQALPKVDTVSVHATTTGGDTVVDYSGQPVRRSVFDGRGIRVWR